MIDDLLLDTITGSFIESAKRDGFNGVPASALLRIQPNPDELRALLSTLLRDGQITAGCARARELIEHDVAASRAVDERIGDQGNGLCCRMTDKGLHAALAKCVDARIAPNIGAVAAKATELDIVAMRLLLRWSKRMIGT
jgi:hypothetical protein